MCPSERANVYPKVGGIKCRKTYEKKISIHANICRCILNRRFEHLDSRQYQDEIFISFPAVVPSLISRKMLN